MSSSAITKQSPQDVERHGHQGALEAKEHSASASASAGLNLNLVGAVSGMFSSKSKKDTAADGNSTEHRDERAHVKGAGAGNLNAAGAAQAHESGREMRQAVKDGKA